MKYYIIAGEASGDLHGSNLIKALRQVDKKAEIRGWGGDLMQAAGAKLSKHYKELAFMGFLEVLKNILTIFKNFSFCKKDILNFQPDTLIFIDYSGFNLRIAKWAKSLGFKTNYYISPQVWASRVGRVKSIRKNIDHMCVILPFEKDFYAQYKYLVTFVGHPLIDAICYKKNTELQTLKKKYTSDKNPIIALLPGSRKQEISKMLTVMLGVVDNFPNYQFVVGGAPSLHKSFYEPFLTNPNVHFMANKTHDLLSISTAALVASGTATLEAALFKVPQVVCYKGSWFSYQIAKRIITLKYISLVNLIMDKKVVKELIQNDFNIPNLKKELSHILKTDTRKQMLNSYDKLETALGGKGASLKTAQSIYNKWSYMKKDNG